MNIGKLILDKVSLASDDFRMLTDTSQLNKNEILHKLSLTTGHLQKCGIKAGDKVLISGSLGDEYWIYLIACWLCGAIIIPIDPKIASEQFNSILEIAKPNYLCGTAAGHHDEPLAENLPKNEDENKAIAAILFTSGSTGVPKGVVLTQQSLMRNCLATLKVIKLTPSHKLFIATNYHYTSTLCHFLAAIFSGCTFLSTNRLLMQSDMINLFIGNNCTAIGGSPIHLRWLAEGCLQSNYNLEWAMSSGDYLSSDIVETYLNYLPHTKLYTVYGLTEVAGRFCILPAEQLRSFPGSVGQAIDCLKIKIIDEQGLALDKNQEGEIVVSGETLMNGYFGQPPSSTTHEFKTGDIGYLNENGMLYLSGRKDDVFKCAGQKISLVHIQQQIHKLDLFKELAVLPIPDQHLGHIACLFYVAATESLDKPAILKRLRDVLAGPHLPKKLIAVDSLPRLGSGKLNRKILINLAVSS